MGLFKKNEAGPETVTLAQRFKLFTWPVALGTVVCSLAMFNFGYDMLVFSGVSAMPWFNRKFGVCNGKGVCLITTETLALMNATPWVGKLIGIWIAAPIARWLGRKPVFAFIIISSWIGVALQISSTTAAQFTVGRIICYGMTGICASILPMYIAETAPAQLRGFLVAQMHLQIALGQIVASAVNTSTSKLKSQASWMIPIGMSIHSCPLRLTDARRRD